MKKTISAILGFILLINILAIAGSCSEHTYRVYGTIELDGEPVEDADVVVKNLDKEYEESTTTDEDGYYEVYINGESHNTIQVEVEFDDLEEDDEFETQSHEYNYEINFDFESSEPSPVKKTYHKVVNMAFGYKRGRIISRESKEIKERLNKHFKLMEQYISSGMVREEASKKAYEKILKEEVGEYEN